MRPVRQAIRSLLRSPAFSLPAIIILAVGIAASSCCFAILDAAVFRAIPFQSPNDLVQVVVGTGASHGGRLSNADYHLIAHTAHCFESLSYEEDSRVILVSENRPVSSAFAGRVSRDYFKTLGLNVRLGRLFLDQDFSPNRPPSVILSHALWVERFSSSADILGTHVRVDNEDALVVGVLPENVRRPVMVADLWVSDTHPDGADDARDRYVIGRLRRAVPWESAARELAVLKPVGATTASSADGMKQQYSPLSVVDQIVGPSRRILEMVLLACLTLQLLACMSTGQLLVGRGVSRMRDAGIRLALGSSTSRLWVEGGVETLILMLFSLLVACGMAVLLLPAASLAASLALGSPIQAHFTLPVAGFSALIAIVSCLLCAIFPALLFRKLNAVTLIRQQWTNAAWSVRASHLQELLMTAQLAATIVLMVAFGLLVKSMYRLTEVSLGFDSDGLSCFVFSAGQQQFPAAAFHLTEAVHELSLARGVKSVAVGVVPFLMGPSMNLGGAGARLANGAWVPLEPPLYNTVSARYFETIGASILDGRPLNGQDRAGAPCAVMVNQALARKVWQTEKVVGRRMTLNLNRRPRAECEVVGLVADIRDVAISRPPEPELFTSILQEPGAATAVIFVRSKAGQSISSQLAAKAMMRADPSRELQFASNIEGIVNRAVAPATARMKVFGALACVALLLASGGSYAAVRFGLSLRMRELGVRMALGGRPRQILALICMNYLRLSVTGVVAGTAASIPLLHLLATSVVLFDVDAFDVTVAATVSLACVAVTMASVAVPTIRALHSGPSRLLLSDTE